MFLPFCPLFLLLGFTLPFGLRFLVWIPSFLIFVGRLTYEHFHQLLSQDSVTFYVLGLII